MSEIQRYDPDYNEYEFMSPNLGGNWVKHSDHSAEVQRLKEWIEELEKDVNAYSGRLATAGDEARSAMVLIDEAPEGWRKRNVMERLAVIEDECSESEELVSGLKSKLTAAEAERDTLRKVLRIDQAWPLKDVLAKLVEATDILLDRKSYDGHGHEEIRYVRNIAAKMVDALAQIDAAGK